MILMKTCKGTPPWDLCVPGVLGGFLDQCWEPTAEDAGDAEGPTEGRA